MSPTPQVTKNSIDTLARIVSAHVASMRLKERLEAKGQKFFVDDIKHLKNVSPPSGLTAHDGHVFVPLNNEAARDDFTLLYEEYVGAAGWHKPMDLLNEKRKIREGALSAELATVDQAKEKAKFDDLTKRLANHKKAREKYALLASGAFPASKGMSRLDMKKMFLLAQKREAFDYIETNHPDALVPFVEEDTFAGIKAVGDLGVNLATDFVPIIRRTDTKRYAFILGDRPDKIFKATLGGMDEGGALVTLLRELTEELSSKDLFAQNSPSRKAFLKMNPKVKELHDFLLTLIPENDRKLYDLNELFEIATKAAEAEAQSIAQAQAQAQAQAGTGTEASSSTTAASPTVVVGEAAIALLNSVITKLESYEESDDNEKSKIAHNAHTLAVKIKVEVDKKYFAPENEALKQKLLKILESQETRAQVGDNRSGPSAVMRTIPWFGFFEEKVLADILAGAYKTMCGGDDLSTPSIVDIDIVNYDLLFAEHAGILIEAVAWLFDKQSKAKDGVDPILLEQIQNIRTRNPKLNGVLTLCEEFQANNQGKVEGDLFLELSRDLKLLLAYQKLQQKGNLPNRDVSAAIDTLNLYLFNRTLATSNEEVAKTAKMDFNTAANQVIAAARELKLALNIAPEEWPTRNALKKDVKDYVVVEEVTALRAQVVSNPQEKEIVRLKEEIEGLKSKLSVLEDERTMSAQTRSQEAEKVNAKIFELTQSLKAAESKLENNAELLRDKEQELAQAKGTIQKLTSELSAANSIQPAQQQQQTSSAQYIRADGNGGSRTASESLLHPGTDTGKRNESKRCVIL